MSCQFFKLENLGGKIKAIDLCGGGNPIFFSSISEFQNSNIVFELISTPNFKTNDELTEWICEALSSNSPTSNEPFVSGNTTYPMCRNVDNKKVMIRECKLSDGTLQITDLDSGLQITDTILASNYSVDCVDVEKENLDTQEFTVNFTQGDIAQDVVSPSIYDAVEIFNCSGCSILVCINLNQPDNSVGIKKISLLSGERRVLDYGCDAISNISIGEVNLSGTGVINTDTLNTILATQDFKVRVTYFNS